MLIDYNKIFFTHVKKYFYLWNYYIRFYTKIKVFKDDVSNFCKIKRNICDVIFAEFSL